MRDELTAWLEQTGAPGVSVAIDDGHQISCFSQGVGDLRTRTPVSEATAFQLGSVSKVVTAFVLLEILAEKGISVDTPVVDLAPDLEASNERAFHDITVRHLLSHTSGLDSQWWVDLGRGDCARRQAARAIAATPLIARPGELFSYSGPAFVLAGYLVDLLAGASWEEAVRDTVARHLGDHSISARPEDVLLRPSATGYRKPADSDVPFAATRWYAPLALSPGGGLVATAPDLTRLMKPIRQRLGLGPRHGDGRITPTIGWRYAGWGLGMARYRLADGSPAWGHDGTTSGQACAVRLSENGPETVVVSTNAAWAASAASHLAETILTRLRDDTGRAAIEPRHDALEAYDAWRLPANADLSGRYLRLNSTILVRPGSNDGLIVEELSSPQDEANWFGQKTPHGAAGTTDILSKVGPHSCRSATREFHFLRHPEDPARQYIHNGMRASVKSHRPWM